MARPRKALHDAGVQTSAVSPKKEKVRAWNFTEWGQQYAVDVPLDRANPDDFDALLLPGEAINADKLRMQPGAVSFAKAFFDADKPAAVICHGPWTVIETAYARGKANCVVAITEDRSRECRRGVYREAVVDGNLVSSRNPDDIPAFIREMIHLFCRAGEQMQKTA